MAKFILLMVLCSGIPGNNCKPIPTPVVEFDTYHECAYYGYDYSSELLRTFDTKSIDEFKMFTAFDCQENSSV